MPVVRIGILALQGAFSEHQAALRRISNVQVLQVRFPEQLAAIDGLIIPGGESPSMLRLGQDMALLPALKRFVQQGGPVWGVCAGAILLAKTVDGVTIDNLACMDITLARNAFGRQVASFVGDLILPERDEPFRGIFIRAPRILEKSPSVSVLAHLAGRKESVAVVQAHCMATTFHPELTDDLWFHQYFLHRVCQLTPHSKDMINRARMVC